MYEAFSNAVKAVNGIIAGPAVVVPVSYTHLDVYKRQVSRWDLEKKNKNCKKKEKQYD